MKSFQGNGHEDNFTIEKENIMVNFTCRFLLMGITLATTAIAASHALEAPTFTAEEMEKWKAFVSAWNEVLAAAGEDGDPGRTARLYHRHHHLADGGQSSSSSQDPSSYGSPAAISSAMFGRGCQGPVDGGNGDSDGPGLCGEVRLHDVESCARLPDVSEDFVQELMETWNRHLQQQQQQQQRGEESEGGVGQDEDEDEDVAISSGDAFGKVRADGQAEEEVERLLQETTTPAVESTTFPLPDPNPDKEEEEEEEEEEEMDSNSCTALEPYDFGGGTCSPSHEDDDGGDASEAGEADCIDLNPALAALVSAFTPAVCPPARPPAFERRRRGGGVGRKLLSALFRPVPLPVFGDGLVDRIIMVVSTLGVLPYVLFNLHRTQRR